MTKEELIRYGNDYYRDLVNACCEIDEKHKEFVRESIKALEQQPVTTTNNDEPITVIYPTIFCDDAISRQAVLDCFTATKLKKFDFILYAREEIKKLPPVTSKQKYGKWVERESGTDDKENGFETVIVCSHCDFPATTFYLENCESRTQIRTDFCPNCGAKMQESKETGEIHCNHTDTEIAKSFIEDVEAVKELLPKAGSEDKTE